MKLKISLKNTNNQILIAGLIIILLKIFIIEIDPPKFSNISYQPIDEFYYGEQAFNMFEYGKLTTDENDFEFFGCPYLTNIVAYLTLKTFGDNYYGFRLSSLFFALLSFVFFWSILKKLTSNNKIQLLGVLFFTLNFSFSYASIIVEPTISRIFSMLLLINILFKIPEQGVKNYHFIGMAIISTLLLILVYPTNLFTVLVVFLSLIILKYNISNFYNIILNFNRIFKDLFVYASISLLTLVFVVFIFNFYDINLFASIFNRGSHYENRVSFGHMFILKNIINIFDNNSFIVNPLFLVLFVFSFFYLSSKIGGNKKLCIIYICITVFVFQTVFINDYPRRKLVMLLPLCTLIVFAFLDHIYKEKKFNNLNLLLIIAVLYLSYYIFRTSIYSDNGSKSMYYHTGFLLLTLAIATLFFFKEKNGISIVKFNYIVAVFILLPELVYSTKYFIVDRSEEYKNAMKRLSVYDGKNFYGGFSSGFRAYNKINVYLNIYMYYGKEDIFYAKIDILSKNDIETNYLISYADNKEELRKINYFPIDTLLAKNQTVYTKDIILFRENENNSMDRDKMLINNIKN